MPHYKQLDVTEGQYRRADGTRVALCRVENIRTPNGYNEGWEYFADDAAAAAAWGLTYAPLPEPQEDEEQQ